MRDVLKSSGRWLSTNWLWPLVLLALPNCSLSVEGLPPNFDPGDFPTGLIMCDIPKTPAVNGSDECAADASEFTTGITNDQAAVALAQGQHNNLVFNYSATALAECNGLPSKRTMADNYPDGTPVCMNCGQVPKKYQTTNKACAAKCVDVLSGLGGVELPTGVTLDAYCDANAHVSTNFQEGTCYDQGCENGVRKMGFVDPRTLQELVGWTDQNGTDTEAPGNTLVRVETTTNLGGNLDFNAGASSVQIIEHGDGWIEFEANETDKQHVLGVSNFPGTKDMDPSLADIGFGITLADNGHAFILENNAQIGPDMGLYQVGQRYRVYFTDNHDQPHTAKIRYARLIGPCTPGTVCMEDPFASQFAAVGPSYPLRVDTSFKQQGAKLVNVTMVRIQFQAQ
jgi:hypothetical protein